MKEEEIKRGREEMACRYVTEECGLREDMPSSQMEIGKVPK